MFDDLRSRPACLKILCIRSFVLSRVTCLESQVRQNPFRPSRQFSRQKCSQITTSPSPETQFAPLICADERGLVGWRGPRGTHGNYISSPTAFLKFLQPLNVISQNAVPSALTPRPSLEDFWGSDDHSLGSRAAGLMPFDASSAAETASVSFHARLADAR